MRQRLHAVHLAHTGCRCQLGQRQGGKRRFQCLKIANFSLDETFIFKAAIDDRLHQAVDQRQFTVRPILQHAVRKFPELHPAHVGDHQFGVVFKSSLDDPVFGTGCLSIEIAPEDQDCAGIIDLVDGCAGARQPQFFPEHALSRSIAEPRLGIDIAGTDCSAHEFLEKEVFFICDTGRSDACNRIGARSLDYRLQLFGSDSHARFQSAATCLPPSATSGTVKRSAELR